jgi:hypothetical protein
MTVNDIINTELLFHPYNWVIVVLILAISTFALCLLAAPLGQIGGLTQVF